MKAAETVLRFATSQALVAFVWLAALVVRGADPPSTNSAAFRAGSSNEVSVVGSVTTTNLPNRQHKTATVAGLVESNGMYSIDIKVEPPEELLPAGTSPMPLDMKQVLAIYAELTGAELKVVEDVRQFPGLIQFPKQYPAMTRAQVCDLFEKVLREQAGVEVLHPDRTHAVLRFQKKPPGAPVK